MINLNIKNLQMLEDEHIKYVKKYILKNLKYILGEKKDKKKIKVNKVDIKFLKYIFKDLILDENESKIKDEVKYKYFIWGDLDELNNDFEKTIKKFYKIDWINIGRTYENLKKAREYRIFYRVKNILDYILGYDVFNKKNGWNRHEFITSLNIKVCPYCNRNYITSYLDEEESIKKIIKTTADADHYYIKNLYPILQMNIYNLIPACQICNSRMKGKSEIRHLYPYRDFEKGSNFEDIKFNLNYDSIEKLFSFTEKDIDIEVLAIADKQEAKNSIELFKLKEVYKIHNDVVFKLIEKIKILKSVEQILKERNEYKSCSVGYIEVLLGEDISKQITVSNQELREKWLGFRNNDICYENEPLLKLKKDIYNQIYDV